MLKAVLTRDIKSLSSILAESNSGFDMDFEYPVQGYRTLVHLAMEQQDVTSAGILLKAGASPKHFNSILKLTPLHVAVKSCSTDAVSLLLGLLEVNDLDPRDRAGRTPLLLAARKGMLGLPCLRLLLDAGASVHVRDNQGGNGAIQVAALAKCWNAVVVLFSKGIDISTEEKGNLQKIFGIEQVETIFQIESSKKNVFLPKVPEVEEEDNVTKKQIFEEKRDFEEPRKNWDRKEFKTEPAKNKVSADKGCRAQYKCHGCELHLRGSDLPRHYREKTNWDQLIKLKACVGEQALSSELHRTDSHTSFIFKEKYSRDNLPTWRTHVQWKGAEENAAGQQKIKHFFGKKTETVTSANLVNKKGTEKDNLEEKMDSTEQEDVIDPKRRLSEDENEQITKKIKATEESGQTLTNVDQEMRTEGSWSPESKQTGEEEEARGEEIPSQKKRSSARTKSSSRSMSRESEKSESQRSRSPIKISKTKKEARSKRRSRYRSSSSRDSSWSGRRRKRRQSQSRKHRSRHSKNHSSSVSSEDEDNNNVGMSNKKIEELAELVAQKVKRIQNEEAAKLEEEKKNTEVWDEGQDFLNCR